MCTVQTSYPEKHSVSGCHNQSNIQARPQEGTPAHHCFFVAGKVIEIVVGWKKMPQGAVPVPEIPDSPEVPSSPLGAEIAESCSRTGTRSPSRGKVMRSSSD